MLEPQHCTNFSKNGTEFKSKLKEKPFPAMWHTKDFHFPPHYLQANRKLESSYRFIKDPLLKFSVDGVLELDQLLPYAIATFSWFPNQHSQE